MQVFIIIGRFFCLFACIYQKFSIAAELGIPGDEVRAYFNGEGNADYHIEPGPDGGIVVFSNTRILEVALRRAWEAQNEL